MQLLKHISATLIMTCVLCAFPLAVSAQTLDYGDGGVFATPASVMGRFVFIERIPRRLLRELAERQFPLYRPRLARLEI